MPNDYKKMISFLSDQLERHKLNRATLATLANLSKSNITQFFKGENVASVNRVNQIAAPLGYKLALIPITDAPGPTEAPGTGKNEAPAAGPGPDHDKPAAETINTGSPEADQTTPGPVTQPTKAKKTAATGKKPAATKPAKKQPGAKKPAKPAKKQTSGPAAAPSGRKAASATTTAPEVSPEAVAPDQDAAGTFKPAFEMTAAPIPAEAMKAKAVYIKVAPNLYKWTGAEIVYKVERYTAGKMVIEYFTDIHPAQDFIKALIKSVEKAKKP